MNDTSRAKKDVIVSVRLPHGLVEELRDIQKINHFMDLSDEVRFIVRRYCLKFLNSDSSKAPIEAMLEQKRNEKLISELTKIIDSLKTNSISSSTDSKEKSELQFKLNQDKEDEYSK